MLILVHHRAKEARAEQNRRAQQAFRRRREEKMKGLEAAAAALEPTQRRLQEVESKLIEAALVSSGLVVTRFP